MHRTMSVEIRRKHKNMDFISIFDTFLQKTGDVVAARKARGIKCSRKKLDAALAASQIAKKTQIALAEALADAEQLESVPKDLVNKMFRELPVDHQTVERVAAILDVKPESLYLEETSQNAESNDAKKHKFPQPLVWWALGIVAILLVAIFFFQQHQTQQSNCYSRFSLEQDSNPNSLVIVIGRLAGDPNNQAQLMLASLLASDNKLTQGVQVYTSCFVNEFSASESLRAQINDGHNRAKLELQNYQADIIVWGERFENRLNLRITSALDPQQASALSFMGKPVVASQQDFVMNFRIDDDETLSSDLPLVLLHSIQTEETSKQQLKQQLVENYNYSGNWLKEAVLSDNNLLKRLSPTADPKLYTLTTTQLCFRRRLLGDIESSNQQYQLATRACEQALEITNKDTEPMQWASITGNLAAIELRQHLYANNKDSQQQTLQSALTKYQQIEQIYIKHASATELATYYQNFAAAHIRLAELLPEQMAAHLAKALELNQQSLDISSASDNPLYYAQRLQNQCVVRYRLGASTQKPSVLEIGINDCEAALALVNVQQHPQMYAMIQNNLAISHAILAELKSSPSLLSQALALFEQTQQTYTKEKFLLNWAQVELNKAELKCKLSLMSNDPSLLEEALESADAAELVFVQKQVPSYINYLANLKAKIIKCDTRQLSKCSCSN